MGGEPSKRPRPSYEIGRLRDKSVKKEQPPAFKEKHLHEMIKKAATKKS
jgi:hypothetical protein